MQGPEDDPFVYLYREAAHGTYYPQSYGFTNRNGRTLHGYLESVFMGTESRVRKDIAEGRLADLPWWQASPSVR